MSNAGKVAQVITAAPIGYASQIVEVECDMKAGLPSLQIVGMGSKAIDEAKERVRSAIANSLLDFPAKKFIINLAPAEMPKDGTHYDLSIAIAILTSSGQLHPLEVKDAMFAGELGLDGQIRPVRGIISIAEAAKNSNCKILYLPTDNAPQAELIEDIVLIPVDSLKNLFLHLKREKLLLPYTPIAHDISADSPTDKGPMLDDILGQAQAKRALTIAAAGRHNILLTGPPGAGKTMMARVLPGLLPSLSHSEKISVTKLYSLNGSDIHSSLSLRPFRSPHHTSSRIAMIGGGNPPKPGDISLAHNGILFLDEMPEYPRSTLEALRQPLEDKEVTISRADGHVTFPANFMLVATMNPCPCGYYGDAKRECTCSSVQILKYQQRLSGPLLDRIDLVIQVSRVNTDELSAQHDKSYLQHNSARKLIDNAIITQHNRYKSSTNSNTYNSGLSSKDVRHLIPIAQPVRELLLQATERLGLSTRSYFKIIKVARTIADLEGATELTSSHIAEALQYRLPSL